MSFQDTIVIVVVCHSNHFTQNTQQQKHRIDKYTLLINNHYYIHQSNYIATLAFYQIRKINKGISNELEKNVTLALCLSMSSIYKFERKTRDCMRLYLKLGVKPDGPLSFKELEYKRNHMKTYRSHRNVMR
jgi:hypothetical protein